MQVTCSQAFGSECNEVLNSDDIYGSLAHYNESHDPSFVAKCRDDLLVEYNEQYTKLLEIR